MGAASRGHGLVLGPRAPTPVAMPGCEGLYLANTTIESDSGPVEICAHAGLLASHAILDAESASPGA